MLRAERPDAYSGRARRRAGEDLRSEELLAVEDSGLRDVELLEEVRSGIRRQPDPAPEAVVG